MTRALLLALTLGASAGHAADGQLTLHEAAVSGPPSQAEPLTGPAGAPAGPSGAPAADADPDALADFDELEAYVDGLMGAYRDAKRFAGATVAVVRDGELLFSKGYGWADVEARTPVDPATSLFRIGSVTKLFTWVAVMQLHEAGEVDLDADVNDYLDFSIPDTYDEPITLRSLMTHTPGFEDRAFALFSRLDERSRGERLADHVPARVRPPGVRPSYSNYGSSLAGYIVERVSGLSWEDYVERHILEPLGMHFATARQPLPADLEEHRARGYLLEGGRHAEKDFERIEAHGPAGGVSASADAMAPFMLAILGGGAHGDVRILEEESVEILLERASLTDPRINDVTHGFYEQSSHGLRIVGHGGGTLTFFTDLALIPEEDLGIFVSFNSDGGAVPSMGPFRRALLDRYFGGPPSPPDGTVDGWEERAPAYEGTFVGLRRSETTFEKLLAMVMFRTTVEAGEDGELVVRHPMGTTVGREVEPGYFHEVDGHLELAFEGSPEEGYSHLFVSDLPPVAFERAGWRYSAGLHLALLALVLVALVSLPVAMLVRYVAQRRFAEVPPLRGAERWVRWAGVGILAVLVAFVMAAGAGAGDMEAFLAGEGETALRSALTLSLLLIPLAMVVAAGAVQAYRRGWWGRFGRVHFSAVAVAALLLVAGLGYWNLLGWWNV